MDDRHNVNIHMNWPQFIPQSPWKVVLAIVLLALGSVVSWDVILSGDQAVFGKIRIIELIVTIIVLAVNIYGVLFRGYGGFLNNLKISMVGHVCCAVIGFYIGGVHLLASMQFGGAMLRIFLEFVLDILLTFLLAVIPVGVMSLVLWLVMMLFGSDA